MRVVDGCRQVEDTAQKLSTRCRWLAYQYFLGLVLCPLVIALSFLDFLVRPQPTRAPVA